MKKINTADFHRPDPVPEEAIKRAESIMRSGEMFRYSGKPESSEILLLEKEFAKYIGAKYALGLNSCSSAIFLALIACGVKKGDKILMPAFTFTAVPSAIIHMESEIIPVECNNNYRVDIEDFKIKAAQSGAKVFLLSYMRGQTSDLDEIQKICKANKITIIEDAAHALGNRWRGKKLGKFGRVSCFSFQSNKIINSGEGGMLVTDDPEIIAKAVYLSGAYEKLPEKHFLDPQTKKYFNKYQDKFALYNMRATNLMGAIVRPQLRIVEAKAKVYRAHYDYLVKKLSESKFISVPDVDPRETRVPDSIQFRLNGFSAKEINLFGEYAKKAGVPISAFGADKNNARSFWNWKYANKFPELPITRKSLMNACDMRLQHPLTEAHLDYLAEVILGAVESIKN